MLLSQHLMWEHTPLGGVRAGEQSALAGRRGPQKLLIVKAVPGSTCKSWGARDYFSVLAEQRPLLEPCMCRGAII
jgi:hypothetical protein